MGTICMPIGVGIHVKGIPPICIPPIGIPPICIPPMAGIAIGIPPIGMPPMVGIAAIAPIPDMAAVAGIPPICIPCIPGIPGGIDISQGGLEEDLKDGVGTHHVGHLREGLHHHLQVGDGRRRKGR
jgi:hypothetical protein